MVPPTEPAEPTTVVPPTEPAGPTTVEPPTEPAEPTTLVPPTEVPPTPAPSAVCRTAACVSAAEAIKSSLNADVKPCDDFYEHVCGNWKSTHELPASKGRLTNFDVIGDVVAQRLKDIFAKKEEEEAESLAFVRRVFQACNDLDALEKDGLEPLQKVTDAALTSQSWAAALGHAVAKYGLNAISSIGVQPNAFNSSQYVFNLDQPAFGVGWNELVNDKDKRAVEIKKAYTSFLAKNLKLVLRVESDEEAQKAAEEVVAFETELAKAATAPADRRDVVKMTVKKSVGEFRKETSFDWIEIVKDVLFQAENFNITVSDEDIVIVNDVEYFKKASDLVKNPDRTKTIQQYIALRSVQEFGHLSTNELRNHQFEFDKVREGITEPHVHQNVLTENLISDVPSLVGRLYVDAHFTESEKTETQKLIQDILREYSEMLQKADWLGEESKKEALQKITSLKLNVGYADWIKNDDLLNQLYKFKSEATNGLELYLELKRVVTGNHFWRLTYEKVDREREWPMSPALVNAAYEPSQNSITFPAAILQGVFFDASRPKYLNYGAIGHVIGHEVSHGFDDQGAKYDHEGNLHNWWGKEAEAEFEKKAQCFVDQYGKVFVDEVKLHLDGKNTLGENIADNGGLHQSENAYGQLQEQEGTLPDLPFTEEQLYFVSNANIWCGLIRDATLRDRILTDVHSPAKYRVNVPVSNNQRFAEVFECPEGSPMNPEAKCELW